MRDIFLLRDFDPPVTAEEVLEEATENGWCFKMHRVDWCGSFLATGGKRMLCCFRAADMESARLALEGADLEVLWSGTVHDGLEPVEPNVIVERSFAAPAVLADVQAIARAGRWCLETHDVRHVRTFFSLDRQRMVCFYRAPDAEAVRRAQREAKMPVDIVWSFEHISPSRLAQARPS